MSATRRRPPPKSNLPHQRPHAKITSRRALRIVPRERAAATEERRPSATPRRARRHDQAGARSASAALQAAVPCAPRDGDRPREEATAPTTTRREREPPNTKHPAERRSHRHGKAAAERHAVTSAAKRPSWNQERQLGAASTDAVIVAQRRLPPEKKRPRQRPCTESASRRTLHAPPRQRASATKERLPSATPRRARRHDRTGTRASRRR